MARELAVLALYLALTVAATFPLVFSFATAIPPGGDSLQFYWNLWWVKRALVDLQASPLFTADLYYPYGASLYFHTLNLLPSVLAVPIVVTVGLPAAYNSLVLLAFALTGYGMYRLSVFVISRQPEVAADLGGARNVRLAAFVAGVTFTFSSYHLAHLHGHLDLLSMQWLPFFALFALKSRDEQALSNPVLCGAFLAAAALTSFYYLLFLLVFTALFVAHFAIGRRRAALPAIRRVGVAIGVAVMLASPLLGPMLIRGRTEGRTLDAAGDMVRFSTDAVAFVLPSPFHPVWGAATRSTHNAIFGIEAGAEQIAFLGYVTLVLAAVAVRRSTFWLPAALLFMLLALGPIAHVGGRVAPLISSVMPYRLIASLPYGDIPRVPVRFVVMAQLCLSVLAGLGMWWTLRKVSRPAGYVMTVAVVAASLFENAAVPLPMQSVDVPAYFSELRESADRRGVLEVPIPDDPSLFPSRMLFQTVHGHPIYQGYISRGFPTLPFGAVPGFAQFKTLTMAIDDVMDYGGMPLAEIGRRVLRAYGAGHVVIEKRLMADLSDVDRARRIGDDMFGASARVYEDASTLAFAVPSGADSGPPIAWLESGWSYLEHFDPRGTGNRGLRWRWMSDTSRVAVLVRAPATVSFKITAQAYRRLRRLRVSVGDVVVATLAVEPNPREYEIPALHVPGGLTFVDFTSLDGSETPGPDPRKLSIAIFRLMLLS